MAEIIPFLRRSRVAAQDLSHFLSGFSIEVTPRTAARVENFRDLLPRGTRVYVAHIDGTNLADMLATARRLVDDGFAVMPHVPARGIRDRSELRNRIAAYSDVGVHQALVIAGGIPRPRGDFSDSMQLLETGIFDRYGFTDLHVAGHPEGSRDIADPAAALRWKNDFQTRTDARMALTTQFCFEAQPIIDWAERIRDQGITLPVHIGIAGPAKLQTLLKFAMTCGIGPSLSVLHRRAADLSRLMLPFEPTDLLATLARHKAAHPEFAVERVHLFPLGGITATTDFAARHAVRPRRARA